MATKQVLADEHQRALARQPERLTAEEKDKVRRLAEDVPALWRAQSTTSRDRQTIARMMLDRVVIRVIGETERAEVKCHRAGEIVTTHPIVRTVRRFEQLEHHDEIMDRIAALRAEGVTARQQIAEDLNAKGWTPAKKPRFDALIVQKLLVRKGFGKKRPIWSGNVPRRNDDEVTLQELAEQIGVHRQTATAGFDAESSRGASPKWGHNASGLSAYPTPQQESGLESHHDNTIEMAFSRLKAHLRSIGARTIDQLIEAIGEICDLFTPQECWNFFKAAGYVRQNQS